MNAPRSGCPINLTLEALGDRWSLIVIRDLTSFSYALRSGVTDDRSPPVGFWEAEGPFVTING